MGINEKLLPVKAHFFFVAAGFAPVHPFVPLIIKELGFSATIVGVINTIVPLTCMLAKPWAGIAADKFNIHKYLLVVLILSCTCSVMMIRHVPALPTDSRVALICGGESTELLIDTDRASDQCFINTLSSTLNRTKTECEFLAREWQGGLIHALESNASSVNSTALTSENIFVTLGMPRKKESNLIAILVSKLNIGSHVWVNPFCFNSSELTGDLICQIPTMHEIVTKPVVSNADVFRYSSFWLLLAVALGFRVLGSCIENLADSLCFKLLEDNPHNYGLQRMWGAAGWGLTSFLTGLLVDWMSEGKPTTDRSIAFYLSIASLFADALVCLNLKVRDVHSKKNEHIFSNVGKLLLDNPKFLVFLVLVVGCGIFSAMVWNFLFWLIAEIAKEDGCSDTSMIQTLNGLVLAVNCYLGEIPFFFLSGRILKKIGYEHCMTLVLVAFGVRFVSYHFLTNPWWILPIEALNGVSFGLFYATMTTYANALTPPGLEGTMQGIVSAAFEGIGLAAGSLISGYVFDQVGGRTLFLFGGAAALCLAAVHSLLLLCWTTPRERPPADEDSDDYAVQGLRIPPEQNNITEHEEWN